jgi:predicted MFS family arabinose efflux permease
VVLGAVGRAAPPARRSFAFGIVTAGGSLGQFLFVPVEQALLESFGWSDALIIVGAGSLIMVLFAFGLGEGESGAAQGPAQTPREALVEAAGHRSFLLLTSGFFVCGFQVVFIATHLPAFCHDRGIDPAWSAWALALVGLFNIVGSLGAGWFGGRYPKRLGLVGFYLVRSLIIAAFVLLPASGPSTLVFGALIGVFWLGTVPLTSGLIATFFGTRYMAMLYGIVFASHQVGSFLGAWAGGAIFDRFGSYDLMWWLTVASGLAAAAIHFLIDERPVARLAATPAE